MEILVIKFRKSKVEKFQKIFSFLDWKKDRLVIFPPSKILLKPRIAYNYVKIKGIVTYNRKLSNVVFRYLTRCFFFLFKNMVIFTLKAANSLKVANSRKTFSTLTHLQRWCCILATSIFSNICKLATCVNKQHM